MSSCPSSSSPTFTTARTGLLVSRNHGRRSSRSLGVEAGAIDRACLRPAPRGRLRAPPPRRPGSGPAWPPSGAGPAGTRPSPGRPGPARAPRSGGARAGRSDRARRRPRRPAARSTMASTSRMPPRNRLPRPSPLLAPSTSPPMSTTCTAAWTTLRLLDISASRSRRWSGTLATPTFGSLVAKAYGAASAPPPVSALYSDDLPALGRPTSPNRSIPNWRGYGVEWSGVAPARSSRAAPVMRCTVHSSMPVAPRAR